MLVLLLACLALAVPTPEEEAEKNTPLTPVETALQEAVKEHYDAGKLGEALDVLAHLIELQSARLGAPHLLVFDNRLDRCALQLANGQLVEAQTCLESLSDDLQWQRPELTEHRIVAATFLSDAHKMQGHFDAAEATLVAAEALLKGAEIRDSLRGMVLRERGELALERARPVEARDLFLEALPLIETRPEELDNNASTLSVLAVAYQQLGDLATARPYMERAVAEWRTLLGDQHPQVALGLNNLAILHLSLNDLDAAEQLFRESLRIRLATLGEQIPTWPSPVATSPMCCVVAETWPRRRTCSRRRSPRPR